jgi:predicted deacylase
MLEGFLRWLRGDGETAAELRRVSDVFVVGFLNPDGVLAGNQRVNRAGLDLNRQWADPDLATAPTIHALQREILDYANGGGRVRILVDFHAAPGGRSNFFFYNDAETSSPELWDEIRAVLDAATGANPDFVPPEGSTARPTTGGARARSWAFDRLGTHGLTVEASSNDVTYGPFQGQYATEERLWALGQAVGVALAEALYGIGEAEAVGRSRLPPGGSR